VKRRAGRIAFTALLFAAVGALLNATIALSPQAQLVPFAVVVVTFVLLGVQLVTDIRASRKDFEASGPYWFDWLRDQVRHAFWPGAAGTDASETSPRELTIFLWIVALPATAWLVGIAPGISVYTFTYLRKRAEERWAQTLIVTSIVAAFPWTLAQLGITGRLYEGALWRWIGI
jgi:hypothetical protein